MRQPSLEDLDIFKSENGYEIDDFWFPRVTKIVSIKAKPALLRYYAEAKNFAAAQEITEQSAREGTLIHETIEKILLNQPVDIPSSISAAIQAFKKFYEQNSFEVDPLFIERRVVSEEHRYAGTVDAVLKLNGKRGVLDIKTSQAIYRDYDLQTAAYMDVLSGELPDLETRWILRIDQIQLCMRCQAKRRIKGGREKIRWNGYAMCAVHDWSDSLGEVELKESPSWRHDFEAFLGAKKLWEWEHRDPLIALGYLPR